MDTIDPKLQLVEGIEEQLVLGEELIVHRLKTRKSKPALISRSLCSSNTAGQQHDGFLRVG